MNKHIMFVRYINAECVIEQFNSLIKATEYVCENFNSNKRTSNTYKRKVKNKIKYAIRDKNDYCGGQWIWLNKETEVRI